MFGRRTATSPEAPAQAAPKPKPAAAKPQPEAAPVSKPKPASSGKSQGGAPPRVAAPPAQKAKSTQPIEIGGRSDEYFQTKTTIFNALIDTIDLSQLGQLDTESAAEEIRDIVNEIKGFAKRETPNQVGQPASAPPSNNSSPPWKRS